MWQQVLTAAQDVLGQEATTGLPETGPNRDHWSYFCKRKVTPRVLKELTIQQRVLGVRRAREVGLLHPDDAPSAGKYARDHVVGLDGKVFSSPLRTQETERVDKTTGEVKAVREDTARQLYGEGGVEGLVLGTKFAIASVRSRLANHRVILGLAHFDSTSFRLARPGRGRFGLSPDALQQVVVRGFGLNGYAVEPHQRGNSGVDTAS